MRLIILLLVLYFGYRTLKSWWRQNVDSQRVSGADAARVDDVMVKDPVCEVYFPKREGLSLRVDDQELFFCSPTCRDKYLETRATNEK